MKEKYEKNGKAIAIKSLQANCLYTVNNGLPFIREVKTKNQDGTVVEKEIKEETAKLITHRATMPNSLFTSYMKAHGMTITGKKDGRQKSNDFIVMKFDYNVLQNKGGRVVTYVDEDGKEITNKELRKIYYCNGASISWGIYDKETGEEIYRRDATMYRMLYRNAGKAKAGECVFIRDELYGTALDYLTMGLYRRIPNENAKIVEMSAYQSLSTAAAIDFIHIPLENIFVIPDESVSIRKKAAVVKSGVTKGESENQCYVEMQEDAEISNILWDGMGLMDESIFPEDMEGFIYCRSHFFKSCLFNGRLQEYFIDYYGEEYGTKTLVDMMGREIPVKDIKVIVTENSMKWIKFADLMGCTPEDLEQKDYGKAFNYYSRWMKKTGEMFSIVKTAHRSKWGDLQCSSYQMNASLPTTDKKILTGVAKESISFINRLKKDDDFFIQYLERKTACRHSLKGMETDGDAVEETKVSNRYSFGRVLIALYHHNEDFRKTELYCRAKNRYISDLKINEVQLGRLLQKGDNLTVCGNPLEMLMKVTGQDFLGNCCFGIHNDGVECFTTGFPDGVRLAAFRSPHNAPNNILHIYNVYPEQLLKYFPALGSNVLVVNGIGTDIQQRCNGMDYDSDAVFVTGQKDIVGLAKRAYCGFPTIVNMVEKSGSSSYGNDMLSYAIMDNTIAEQQDAIGMASNAAKLALSYYYDGGKKDNALKDVFIIDSVLAQLSIDSAKKSFGIDILQEIGRLRKLKCMKGKDIPKFYAAIQKQENPQYDTKKKTIRKMGCPMDILMGIIGEKVVDSRGKKEKYESIYGMVVKPDGKGNSRQCRKIMSSVEKYQEEIKMLNEKSEDYYEQRMEAFEDCLGRISGIKKINARTMRTLVFYALNDTVIQRQLLSVLYDKDPDGFLGVFIEKR